MFLSFMPTSDTLLNGIIFVLFLTAIVVIISLLMRKKGPEPPKPPTNILDKQIEERKQTLPIQLQAYERLTLLMDRIELINLLKRVDASNTNVQAHQFQLVGIIRQEYEHNITQQLYVSDESWFLVKSAIESIISTINNVASQQPNSATGQDLNRALLNHVMGSTAASACEIAMAQMRTDMGNLM